jgi:hypothetical protein
MVAPTAFCDSIGKAKESDELREQLQTKVFSKTGRNLNFGIVVLESLPDA